MQKTKLNPSSFAPAMGAYSQGLSVDVGTATMIFVTGQVPLNDDGTVVSDDVAEQARCVFDRIAAILAEANASMDDVVKAQIFLTDINDFAAVTSVRNAYFAASRPASTLVEVNALVVEGCKIEIEVVAIVSKSKRVE